QEVRSLAHLKELAVNYEVVMDKYRRQPAAGIGPYRGAASFLPTTIKMPTGPMPPAATHPMGWIPYVPDNGVPYGTPYPGASFLNPNVNHAPIVKGPSTSHALSATDGEITNGMITHEPERPVDARRACRNCKMKRSTEQREREARTAEWVAMRQAGGPMLTPPCQAEPTPPDQIEPNPSSQAGGPTLTPPCQAGTSRRRQMGPTPSHQPDPAEMALSDAGEAGSSSRSNRAPRYQPEMENVSEEDIPQNQDDLPTMPRTPRSETAMLLAVDEDIPPDDQSTRPNTPTTDNAMGAAANEERDPHQDNNDDIVLAAIEADVPSGYSSGNGIPQCSLYGPPTECDCAYLDRWDEPPRDPDDPYEPVNSIDEDDLDFWPVLHRDDSDGSSYSDEPVFVMVEGLFAEPEDDPATSEDDGINSLGSDSTEEYLPSEVSADSGADLNDSKLSSDHEDQQAHEVQHEHHQELHHDPEPADEGPQEPVDDIPVVRGSSPTEVDFAIPSLYDGSNEVQHEHHQELHHDPEPADEGPQEPVDGIPVVRGSSPTEVDFAIPSLYDGSNEELAQLLCEAEFALEPPAIVFPPEPT
uniref:Fibrous sheath CABYR-binding protein-like n=1 Tax=Drosophila rhopaloa TaxID=1041015 RepID=A0A6P4E199_DRORH